MRDELPQAWPPPWHWFLVAVLFLVAVNAFAQRAWAVAAVAVLVAVLAAMSHHPSHRH